MSSASFASQCPSCGKQFANDSFVLRHMNNPRSSCESWSRFFESLHPDPPDRSANRHPASNGRTSNINDFQMADDDDGTAGDGTATPTHHEDVHPNKPAVLGSGLGFMDRFNADHHAEKRNENLYYPFSSKAEWSLASWLSCSGLSMRAIDEFLALPIVRAQISVIPTSLIECQDLPTFTLLCNRKNTTFPHGRPSESSRMEGTRYSV